MIQTLGRVPEICVLEGDGGVILANVEGLIQRHMPDIGYVIPAWTKSEYQGHIRHVAKLRQKTDQGVVNFVNHAYRDMINDVGSISMLDQKIW